MSDQNNPKTFRVGDTVTWTSQAGGKSKTKTGKVVAEVPAGANVWHWLPGGFNYSRLPKGVSVRSERSYLVKVEGESRLYWPLVKYLEKVIEEKEEIGLVLGAATLISPVIPD